MQVWDQLLFFNSPQGKRDRGPCKEWFATPSNLSTRPCAALQSNKSKDSREARPAKLQG